VRLSPFWGDVLAPAFHALAPGDPVVVAARLRNTAVATAFLSGILPRYGPLGTGTSLDASIVPGAYVVAAVIAHQRRNATRGDIESAAALCLAGLVPLVLSGGVGFWGLWLALVAAFHVASSRVRSERLEDTGVPIEIDPLPKPLRGFAVGLGRLAYTGVTVLVFWTLVTQHMKVPTGSMQPTILGDHGVGNRYGGDRVLADHMTYLLREPRRFDIVVFRYPLRRDILFVKRLASDRPGVALAAALPATGGVAVGEGEGRRRRVASQRGRRLAQGRQHGSAAATTRREAGRGGIPGSS